MASAAKPQVQFTGKWGAKSWKATHNLGALYGNDREPHVEVGVANMDKYAPGHVFFLSNLHVRGNAVMYDVDGCINGAHKAHFTVYYGPDAIAKAKLFPTSVAME